MSSVILKAAICGLFLAFIQYSCADLPDDDPTFFNFAYCYGLRKVFLFYMSEQINRKKLIKFQFEPSCTHCVVNKINLTLAPMNDVDVEYIHENKTAITNTTIIINDYEVICNCSVQHNDNYVLNKLRQKDKYDSQDKCTGVHEPKHANYSEPAVKQCLDSKAALALADSGHKTINVSISSKNMRLNYLMVRPARDPNNHSRNFVYTDRGTTVEEVETVQILHQQVDLDSFPTIDCQHPGDPKIKENSVEVCQCFRQSKVFDAVPEMMAHSMFHCDGGTTIFHGVQHNISMFIKWMACPYDIYDEDE